MPNHHSPSPSPTPTPTPTPFPSPTSPRHPMIGVPHPYWMYSQSPANSESDLANAKALPPASSNVPLSPGSSSRSSDFLSRVPQHPSALLNLSRTLDAPSRFGVLPYPEWRIEVAERAQRAGMGEVGRAMKWMLWQNRNQLDLDLQEVRSRHSIDEQSSEEIRRKRRQTVSLKNRRRSTASGTPTICGSTAGGSQKSRSMAAHDSDASEDTGRIIGRSESGEESSEAEWLGWTADLRRQHRVQGERIRLQKEDRLADESDEVTAPKSPEEDRRFVGERRRLLEPSATVVVTTRSHVLSSSSMFFLTSRPHCYMYSCASTAMSTPSGTLYSQSSSESLMRRRPQQEPALSRSSVDRPTSPLLRVNPPPQSHHGHSQSQPSPLIPEHHHTRRPSGSGLSHSTSYSTGLRSIQTTSDCVHVPRRPSMPSLTDQYPESAKAGPSRSPFPPPSRGSPAFSPTFSTPFEMDKSQLYTSSALPSTPGSSSLSRRASVAAGEPLMIDSVDVVGGSDRRLNEKDEQGKGREGKGKEKAHGSEAQTLRRPKLSVSTNSSLHLPPTVQPMTAQAKSPLTKSRIRRVQSSSSMRQSIPEESLPTSPVTPGGLAAAPRHQRKKKKGAIAYGMEKIVRKLDSAMDFLDEK